MTNSSHPVRTQVAGRKGTGERPVSIWRVVRVVEWGDGAGPPEGGRLAPLLLGWQSLEAG
jgi:hypothetical protein